MLSSSTIAAAAAAAPAAWRGVWAAALSGSYPRQEENFFIIISLSLDSTSTRLECCCFLPLIAIIFGCVVGICLKTFLGPVKEKCSSLCVHPEGLILSKGIFTLVS